MSDHRGDLDALYQALLGRNVDEPGFEYWSHELDRGFRLDDIGEIIKKTDEYAAYQGVSQ